MDRARLAGWSIALLLAVTGLVCSAAPAGAAIDARVDTGPLSAEASVAPGASSVHVDAGEGSAEPPGPVTEAVTGATASVDVAPVADAAERAVPAAPRNPGVPSPVDVSEDPAQAPPRAAPQAPVADAPAPAARPSPPPVAAPPPAAAPVDSRSTPRHRAHQRNRRHRAPAARARVVEHRAAGDAVATAAAAVTPEPPAARPDQAPTARVRSRADHGRAAQASASPLPASAEDPHASGASGPPDAASAASGGAAAVLVGLFFVLVLAGPRLSAPSLALATPPAAPYLGRIVPPD